MLGAASTTPTPSAKPGVRTTQISQQRGNQLLKLLNFPCIKVAMQVLESYLDEFQLTLTAGNSNSGKYVRLSQQQKNLLCRYKRDLVPGILRQGVALGIALVHVPQSDSDVPTLVPWSAVRVTSVLDESKGYRRSWVIESALSASDKSSPVADVFVCDCFGDSAPHPVTGEFRSKMVSVEPSVHTYVEHLQTALRSERVRSQPTAFLESEKTKPDSLGNETSYGYYADAETLERSAATTYEMNQNDMQQLAEQNKTFQAYVDSAHGRATNDDAERASLAATAMSGLAPLPAGTRLARGPEARSPELLIDKLRFIDNNIMVRCAPPRLQTRHCFLTPCRLPPCTPLPGNTGCAQIVLHARPGRISARRLAHDALRHRARHHDVRQAGRAGAVVCVRHAAIGQGGASQAQAG
tara:strand:- start:947 stop:2176 length:1230 start_codon:yes stop_codon:yes gene_type:complete